MPEVPQYLKQLVQFILYRTETDPISGKLNKIPTVSVTDASKWLQYDACSQSAGKLGIGFVLCPALSCTAVVDVDGCRDPQTGAISAQAQAMMVMLPGAYVEVSISGTGIHVWFSYSSEMPAHACRANGMEFYHRERFFAIGTPYSAAGFTNGSVDTDLTMMLPLLIATHFPPASSSNGEVRAWTDTADEDWAGPGDDGELLRRAMRHTSAAAAFDINRATFADLWDANADKLGRAYPDANGRAYDASAADAALAQHLAFWTGRDCERMLAIMKQSALMRDKWERGDYLKRTILGAVARQVEVYQERRTAAALPIVEPAAGGITLTAVERTLANVGTQDAVALIFTQG